MVQRLQLQIIFIFTTVTAALFYCHPSYNEFGTNWQAIKTNMIFWHCLCSQHDQE